MTPSDNSILKKIRDSIKRTDPLATAILFGSRATGNFRKDSDWDILILTDQSVRVVNEQLFRHDLYDIELETREAISTLVYNINDWNTKLSSTPLYYAVKKNGIVL